MSPKLEYQKDGNVARMTLNRPSKRNCLDVELLDQWRTAVEAVEADSDVKVVTVTGSNGNFSAGADLSMFLNAIEADDRAKLQRFIDRIHEVTLALEQLPVPTIAAVRGYALAGGLEVLLACDLRIATEDAIIGDQHANYGLVAGGGGTQRLVRQIDTCRANELMYTGRHLSGTEAEEWGVVNRAVPREDFDDTIANMETELASKSRHAFDLTKNLMRQGRQISKEEALDIERRSVVDHYFTEQAMEGFSAFDEGRQPEF